MHDRTKSLGSSDIAAVCGINPYRSSFDVWAEKVHGVQTPENPAMHWGRKLEAAVLEEYEETTGTPLEHADPVIDGIFSASPDAIGRAEDLIVEAKTARSSKRWGDDGESVPIEYQAQVQWQMGVMDLPRADIAVLISGQDFRIYTFLRKTEAMEEMRERARKFWRDYVETGIAPPITATAGAKAYLKTIRPADESLTVTSDERMSALLLEYASAKEALETNEAFVERLGNELKAGMGPAWYLEGADFRASWKPSKPRTITDWEAAWTELANQAALRGVDAKSILQSHRTQAEPIRPFRVTSI